MSAVPAEAFFLLGWSSCRDAANTSDTVLVGAKQQDCVLVDPAIGDRAVRIENFQRKIIAQGIRRSDNRLIAGTAAADWLPSTRSIGVEMPFV